MRKSIESNLSRGEEIGNDAIVDGVQVLEVKESNSCDIFGRKAVGKTVSHVSSSMKAITKGKFGESL